MRLMRPSNGIRARRSQMLRPSMAKDEQADRDENVESSRNDSSMLWIGDAGKVVYRRQEQEHC